MRACLVINDPVSTVVVDANTVKDPGLDRATHDAAERELRMTVAAQQPAAAGILPHLPKCLVHPVPYARHRLPRRNAEFAQPSFRGLRETFVGKRSNATARLRRELQPAVHDRARNSGLTADPVIVD